MTFRIGQKVVCIKKGFWTNPGAFGDEIFPLYGEIYTVRSIEHDFGYSWIRLREITNPLHHYRNLRDPQECTFRACSFRPVVDRPTDISVFTEILRTTKAPAKAYSLTSNQRALGPAQRVSICGAPTNRRP